MITFELTMGGYDVKVNGKMFGHIDAEEGFFLDPTTIREFLKINPGDLRKIADKLEEASQTLKENIEKYALLELLDVENMNEKTKLFLFLLAKNISWEKLEEYFTEMEEVHNNKFPTDLFPPFKQKYDELVARLEKK